MEKRDAVIILRKGKTCIAFPGAGGYKIEWSAWTKILPLEDSPSGHLVIPCDTFADAKVVQTAQSFMMGHTVLQLKGANSGSNGSKGSHEAAPQAI